MSDQQVAGDAALDLNEEYSSMAEKVQAPKGDGEVNFLRSKMGAASGDGDGHAIQFECLNTKELRNAKEIIFARTSQSHQSYLPKRSMIGPPISCVMFFIYAFSICHPKVLKGEHEELWFGPKSNGCEHRLPKMDVFQ